MRSITDFLNNENSINESQKAVDCADELYKIYKSFCKKNMNKNDETFVSHLLSEFLERIWTDVENTDEEQEIYKAIDEFYNEYIKRKRDLN